MMSMLRASHLPPLATPALSALRLSLIPTYTSFSPSNVRQISSFASSLSLTSSPKTLKPSPPSSLSSFIFNRVLAMAGRPCFRAAAASFSAESGSSGEREILVQHLLVKENDLNLLLDLQQRVIRGEDLSDLAVEFSLCPSKEEGGMLGWVRKGQMVPEFEEAAFNAPLNKVVRCKTQFGWHLLQVLSEREESILQEIPPEKFHVKMQDPSFLEDAQLIDVREPGEVARASLPGFQVLPLQQFGSWGPEITTKFDPQKDTYVMCHHGVRSLQVSKWLQTQGFRRIFNVSGGIHAYALKADQTIPTY
ncbi:rhodanese-like/PpiC domain-containing protein 12, chloroplastic [Humulus lupulus]|uniref:rhodanese-like/PpiC domain-containing protein 12, chloroplastic n=1 Tax=Humulus lupulus TaxID=3486 RepID=UPI002B412F2D|nr:rhodanese-like/PpiC domain-containing protein 12, chloroplastic [Humulus lupulus]XP_062082321.1 rhodanese-like/PpiC domain-containing protein 12, chloroplastic [Humulus lupulus]XP_062082322.1 rhodanese-like/PpiC domain-containing protein 12, chloroplastic [Humulus lupulus]